MSPRALAPVRCAGLRPAGSRERLRGGFSYVEVLLATLLVAMSLVPALEALQTGILGGGVHESQTLLHYHLTSKLEEVLAQPLPDLEAEALASGGAPTSYSDPAGSANRRLVYLSEYDGDDADGDGDPFTGADAGLVWLRVEIEATPHALETLTSR